MQFTVWSGGERIGHKKLVKRDERLIFVCFYTLGIMETVFVILSGLTVCAMGGEIKLPSLEVRRMYLTKIALCFMTVLQIQT